MKIGRQYLHLVDVEELGFLLAVVVVAENLQIHEHTSLEELGKPEALLPFELFHFVQLSAEIGSFSRIVDKN